MGAAEASPDIGAWKSCLSGKSLKACGAASLDLPWARAFKGLKVLKACNSCTPGTEVLMADGTTKPIEDVEIGDKVLTTDPKTGKTTTKTVTAEIKGNGLKHLVRITLDLDGKKGEKTASITATDGHPFWVPELHAWINATDLRTGQWLRTSAGTHIQITAVKHWTQQATVHNLTITDLHTYYVLAGETPVLVHNSGCGPGISTRYEKAGDIGKYADGQKTRDPASQWYHEELSNEELLDGINKPGGGDGILVSRDGTILGGHHRKDELLTRIRNGRIDPDTSIRIDVYDGE